MKSLSKLLPILFFVLLIANYYSLSTISAAKAIPDPAVPCKEDEVRNPEFNSLRPYQASPCRDAKSFASMCGNNIKLTIARVGCKYNGSPTCTCTDGFKNGDKCSDTKTVVIDLSNVKLPILGNTQDVANSETGVDGFDDAQKMNEYVSWYLAGANQKAEYGTDTADKTINYSGPAKKLLPSTIQEYNRFVVLHQAGVKPDYTDPETGEVSKETYNHNQIAVCTQSNPLIGAINQLLGALGSDIWIGSEKPVPCYVNGSKAQGNLMRLVKWWDGKQTDLMTIKDIIPNWDGSQRWGYTTPPFPWQFTEDIYYQKAYNEWRGLECSLDSIIGKLFGKRLLCMDIRWKNVADFHANIYADLYQYIPLSNTVDKIGKETPGGVTVKGDGATTILRSSKNAKRVPKLFYPHTEEVSDAVTNLNKTFVPLEGVDTKGIPINTEENTDSCQILDVRTNAGDDLTFDNTEPKHQLEMEINYEVGEVGCKESGSSIVNPCINPATKVPILGCTATPYPVVNYVCESDITATFDLTTNSPYFDTIWENTTGGAGSTFRKIFPKVEGGAPVSCLADIPGVSSATYELNDASSDSVSNMIVKNPGGSSAVDPEIYFPHLGSVYEYFLKGIQTALRPQGYGEPITNGAQCSISEVQCSQIAQTYGVPSCLVDAILYLESGTTLQSQNQNVGTESCGNFSCCSAGVCGPAQIKCGLYGGLSAGQNIDLCDPCGSAELMSRLLLMKMCQAGGECNSYDWASMKANAEKYKIKNVNDAATAACYYYGQNQGCSPTACTQYRWGAGVSYGDAVKGICAGSPIPENKSAEFCVACSKEDPRVGMCSI